ncbi:gamma-aminobutyric acid type b receptor subunit 2 [Plakobranchus ocellatus]|uniref:Gamma-aminobutyric acid type b receptor subunit 2 n=1 Tax=Plakobranchus ocellatus TaxID=259542 RepID=A0AAV3YTP2_9GAST|nr:gamma-aminobutyric acid type b receptor subunit 2 [Plakobranchus ocellatus]
MLRGIVGTADSKSTLRSAGTPLSLVQAQPRAPWLYGGPENLRSPCCGLAIYKTSSILLLFPLFSLSLMLYDRRVLVTRMRDIHLAGRIMVLVALDIVFIITWVSVDPLQISVTELNTRVDEEDDDHYVIPLVSTCVSSYELYWVGVILVYKGVLLFFGIFLAWETRAIHVDALNDSRHIGLCVYNVAVVCIIGVPLGFIISDENFEGRYVIKSLFVILCTSVILCIVFLPKVS